jgi:uracil-DNA glycosylase
MPSGLTRLHDEIDVCRICESFVVPLQKPSAMQRGNGRAIMIVGQEPGKTERSTGRAFSGPAGRRLDRWLIAAGAAPADPREDLYLTSRIKCSAPNTTSRVAMAHNCDRFLRQQLTLVKPRLVITLGNFAYDYFGDATLPFASALCTLIPSTTYLIFPFDTVFDLLPWPHPSGLNRWLNVPANTRRLDSSFTFVRSYLSSSTTR